MEVLFVCGANKNRSQIAEAIFNRMSKKNHATSAGMDTESGSEGTMLSEALNNPVIPMKAEGYDLSNATIKKLTPAMLKKADKVVLLRTKKRLGGVLPDSFKKLKDFEWWEMYGISDDTPFDEYCRLEKERIKKIESLVKDLVERIG